MVFLICVIGFFLNMFSVPMEKLQAAFVNESLRLGINAMSAGSIAMTVGLILGAVLFANFEKKIPNRNMMIYGGILIGALYGGLVSIQFYDAVIFKYGFYAAMMFLFGFTNSLIGMSVQVTFMKNVPNEFLGRAGSIFNAMACTSIPMGSFLLAMITPFLPINQTYLLVGVCMTVVFLCLGRFRTIKNMGKG